MHEFRCPHCMLTLRVKDQSYRDRVISCPECSQPVEIVDVHGSLEGKIPEDHAVQSTQLQNAPKKTFDAIANRLLFLALLVIMTLMIFTLVMLTRGVSRKKNATELREQMQKMADEAVAKIQKTTEEAKQKMLEQRPEAQQRLTNSPPPEAPTLETQIANLTLLIHNYHDQHGDVPHHFPAENLKNPRFSWLAPIAFHQLSPPHVDWNLNWDAVANDEFVRAPFPAVINPHLTPSAGDDGYPASDFVGVTGIGDDAADLPADHPRAGIFGNRVTRFQNITDGLSNTILIAGVTERRGSWARPGDATMRSFQQEPYINGPDGFGTGQQDEMLVGMADGRVISVSKNIDPVVLRRMAAMADGVPLESYPGQDLSKTDPLTMDYQPEMQMGAMSGSSANASVQSIIDALPVPSDSSEKSPPKFELDENLSKQIVLFEQSRPTPVDELLFELQELIGVPFDLSALSEEQKKTPVALRIENGTLQEILDKLTSEANLVYELDEFRVRILPAGQQQGE